MHSFRHFYLSIFAVTAMVITLAGPAPAREETSGVPMLSGGVGEDDYDAIQNAKSRFNVKMLFTGEAGEYVSDVRVSLYDAAGTEIATTTTEGPILLVKLKPGMYSLKAVEAGFVKEKKFNVAPKGMNNIHIAFPIRDGVD